MKIIGKINNSCALSSKKLHKSEKFVSKQGKYSENLKFRKKMWGKSLFFMRSSVFFQKSLK